MEVTGPEPPRPGVAKELWGYILGSWVNVLLVFFPVSLVLEFSHAPAVWVFVTAGLAIVPLAGLIGKGTEVTAEHVGPGVGGLLNATFGNAAELIIAMFALSRGLFDVVKASIAGSILGNMLLVLGLSMLVGGWGRDRQRFNRTAAGASASMLVLATAALIMPAVWELVVEGAIGRPSAAVQSLSVLTAVILLAIYLASLVFALVTHRELFAPVGTHPAHTPTHSLRSGIVLLVIATGFTAWIAEILVGAIEPAGAAMGLTQLFIGVIIVAVVGNAAEHFSAVVFARRGQMELAFTIAIGSSTQIALLVAPILVLASYAFGRPMDLVFNPFEITAVALAVLSVAVVSLDGESNWFEGLQLIALYLILAIAFYFVPGQAKPALPH